jgi:hypothetical protein
MVAEQLSVQLHAERNGYKPFPLPNDSFTIWSTELNKRRLTDAHRFIGAEASTSVAQKLNFVLQISVIKRGFQAGAPALKKEYLGTILAQVQPRLLPAKLWLTHEAAA